MSGYINDPDYLDRKITAKDLNDSVDFGRYTLNQLKRLETNIASADVDLKKGTPSHGHYRDSIPEQVALQQGKDALVSVKATVQLRGSYCVQ